MVRLTPYAYNRHKKIRKTCKLCTNEKKEHTKNAHRFHGYGSFEATHISYCQKKECGSQDDPTVYRKAAKKRKRIKGKFA